MRYRGSVYQGESGQWSWAVFEDDEEICGGAGYETEGDAEADMLAELAVYEDRQSRHCA